MRQNFNKLHILESKLLVWVLNSVASNARPDATTFTSNARNGVRELASQNAVTVAPLD